jgi:hypothetical protein
MTGEHTLRRTGNPTKWAGQTPWGLRVSVDGGVQPDEYEENVVAVVRHMRTMGRTIREIVEFLREVGVVNRRGMPIGMTRVFEMIHGGRRRARSAPGASAPAALSPVR